MPLPKEKFIELSLLREIQQRGGSAHPDSVLMASIAKYFPKITPSDLQLKNFSGGTKWANRIQWVRDGLVRKGEIDRSTRGVWAITPKGRERLEKEWPSWSAQNVEYSTRLYIGIPRSKRQREPKPNIFEPTGSITQGRKPKPPVAPIATPNVSQMILQRLTSLDPHGFEIFVGKYLDRKGLKNIQITGQSHDGGIDGNAIETFLGIKVAFQAKKWGQGQTVGAGPIRELLGSITNRGADRGVFVTTSSFSPGGKEEAELSQGKIILIDRKRLAQDCIELELGIKPVTKEAAIDEEFFNSLK